MHEPSETDPIIVGSNVRSLVIDQCLKECLAFTPAKPAARIVWCRRGAPAWSSIWIASRRGSPVSSSIPREKVSGCAEVSTLGGQVVELIFDEDTPSPERCS